MFICGSGSFSHHQDDQEERESNGSPCQTPKRSKRSTSFCKLIGRDSSNKNPYADRGLDKFYALLADLDDKKQKIYTQKGSEDISFVRFVYTNDDSSDHVKPIVVKVKDKKQLPDQTKVPINQHKKPKPKPSPPVTVVRPEEAADVDVTTTTTKKKKKKKRSLIRCNLRQPYCYFPVMVVLILLFLAIYGRSFAILCTSIGWYMMPTVVGSGGSPSSSSSSSSSSDQRKPKRKKEYVSSDKKIIREREEDHHPISPKSVINNGL